MNHLLEKRQSRFDGHAGFRKADRNDGLRQIGALAYPKCFSVQCRARTFLAAPHFIANRIVNHADNDFALEAQRNRNAEVRDAVEIIHGAIERIDDPLMLARLIADDSFFAVKRVLGKFFEQRIRDQLLRFDINL